MEKTNIDEILSKENETEQNEKALQQRLKSFSYYLVESIELNLNYCLQVLQESTLIKQGNSKVTTVTAGLASVIPYIGKVIGEAIKEGELYILNKIDKNNARKLADLVYFYGDNKDKLRQILIESAIAIFYSFEYQFMNVTSMDGPMKAMHKLAIDAADRIVNYLLKIKPNQNITINLITKGVVKGASKKDNYGKQSGRTVKDINGTDWHTACIYDKCGLFFEDDAHFYETNNSKTEKYGYRRTFIWENSDDMIGDIYLVEEAKQNYIQDKIAYIKLYNDVVEYIIAKIPEDDAKRDINQKHIELMGESANNQKELIRTFESNHCEQLKYLETNFQEILLQQKSNNEIVTQIGERQKTDAQNHTKIKEKLNEIHQEIVTTRTDQATLMKQTNDRALVLTSELVQNFADNLEEVMSPDDNVSRMFFKVVDTMAEGVKQNSDGSFVIYPEPLLNFVGEIKEQLRENGFAANVCREMTNFLENDGLRQTLNKLKEFF